MTSAALAVEAPYTDNFDSYPTGSMQNNSTQTMGLIISSQWSVQNPSGISGVYENSDLGDDVLTSTAVNVTNLTNSDFILSTNFVLNSFGASNLAAISVGLGALGSTPDFSNSGYRLSYNVPQTATLRPAH